MALMETPTVNLGTTAVDFNLLGTDGKYWSLADCRGKNGILIMFLCNHCPYVQAILDRLLIDSKALYDIGVGSVAIMPNDTVAYPEDHLEKMTELATRKNFPFPYLIDHSQQIARAYGAVCTPDFFGYNRDLQLQYRGRIGANEKACK